MFDRLKNVVNGFFEEDEEEVLYDLSYSDWYEMENREEYEALEEGQRVYKVVEQVYMPASMIILDSSFDELTFDGTGSGLLLEDYLILNKKMIKCVDKCGLSGGRANAEFIIEKYPDVYEAYFKQPIRVLKTDFGYEYMGEGAHRIYVAARLGNSIPLFAVTEEEFQDISFEEYQKNYAMKNWQF